MGKRKRGSEDPGQVNGHKNKVPNVSDPTARGSVTVQIVTGSYERVLHGFQAALPLDGSLDQSSVQFVDTFLFNAHASAIRCLALSPLPDRNASSEDARVTLASGGTDERVNLYSLSASPLAENGRLPSVPTLSGNKILENPANRELGSLLQHASSITALHLPTKSKIIAAAEDNTISISRTKDFEVVATIKPPRPKVQGRPSGDTAPPGGAPMGVNDFAVHPSMKLMVSVGKGERCMRLWNLVTGKKAGVLNFGRDTLESVKEGKYSSGEGRKIEWSPDGEEFAVAYERGAVVFGADSVPSCKVLPTPLTKIHQMKYLQVALKKDKSFILLVVSTEDGRVAFYSPSKTQADTTTNGSSTTSSIPSAVCLASLGGKSAGLTGRIKDFEILTISTPLPSSSDDLLVTTASSDGTVRVWGVNSGEIISSLSSSPPKIDESDTVFPSPKQIGRLVGTYETGNRITCLKAFTMLPPNPEDDLVETEAEGEDSDEEDEEADSDD